MKNHLRRLRGTIAHARTVNDTVMAHAFAAMLALLPKRKLRKFSKNSS